MCWRQLRVNSYLNLHSLCWLYFLESLCLHFLPINICLSFSDQAIKISSPNIERPQLAILVISENLSRYTKYFFRNRLLIGEWFEPSNHLF